MVRFLVRINDTQTKPDLGKVSPRPYRNSHARDSRVLFHEQKRKKGSRFNAFCGRLFAAEVESL